jgi:hypothetical protein
MNFLYLYFLTMEDTTKTTTRSRSLSRSALGAAVVAFSLASPASAALVNTPLPANAFINFGGLDWAWAYPVQAGGFSVFPPADLSFQAPLGWRIPTLAELAAAPDAVDFLFAGANVPFSGTDPVSGARFESLTVSYTGDGACATPYFSSSLDHCDWVDGQPNFPWAGLPGSGLAGDQLFVRDTAPPPAAAPGPLPIFGAAAAFGFSRKLRNRIKTSANSVSSS